MDRELTRLSCRNVEEMWFDVMISYRQVGGFLSGFSILSLVLYFVTSSDSGSLVIDCLASNGHPEPPRLQRLLWALLEGVTATALLVAGGKKALSALQAMSIATGFIYTILICIACIALWRALKVTFHISIQNFLCTYFRKRQMVLLNPMDLSKLVYWIHSLQILSRVYIWRWNIIQNYFSNS